LFPLLIVIYPVFETLFSIYRKKWLRGMSPGVPDGVHLHMLVYKRLMRWAVGDRDARQMTRRNSLTSPYLWLLCMTSVVPAVMFWNNTPVLALFIGLFAATYVALYRSIVRFRTPRWMVFRRTDPFTQAASASPAVAAPSTTTITFPPMTPPPAQDGTYSGTTAAKAARTSIASPPAHSAETVSSH
jgi:hypothetical protein